MRRPTTIANAVSTSIAEPIWQPTCGRVITRHKLVKIETMKEVKSFKCVVVNVCPHCCAQTEAAEQGSRRSRPAKQPVDDSVVEAAAVAAVAKLVPNWPPTGRIRRTRNWCRMRARAPVSSTA